MSDADAPKPSGTVVVLRDGAASLELLLLQRAGRDDKPGAWVFPGGKVEPVDVIGGDPGSLESARIAGARETHEEAGIAIPPDRFAAISRWITPEVAPRRFDTWFFVAGLPGDQDVRVDGSEIVDHRWIGAREALDAYDGGALSLAPPTFVTVTWLSAFERAAHALDELPRRELVTFRPQIHSREGGATILYPGDAGYELRNPEAPGARHRLIADRGRSYRYLRD